VQYGAKIGPGSSYQDEQTDLGEFDIGNFWTRISGVYGERISLHTGNMLHVDYGYRDVNSVQPLKYNYLRILNLHKTPRLQTYGNICI